MEVIYHCLTHMPTSATDKKQITKKRHVGNDIVHIVWCESERTDYRPAVITSQFNDAHIIVYPLRSGLYRIVVTSKEKFFGPLLDGMVVTGAQLPLLVRQTAINANRAVRYATAGYQAPYPTRRALLEEVIEKFGIDTSFATFFGKAVSPLAVPTPVGESGQSPAARKATA